MKKNLLLISSVLLVSLFFGFSARAQLIVYTVTGGGTYCSNGTGVDIGLNGSDIGVSYQLYNGVTAVGAPLSGTGAALDFGLQTAAGTYIVTANPAIAGGTLMSGLAIVLVNESPTLYTVSGGGNYCPGGDGEYIYLNNSDAGVNYQLYVNGVLAGVNLPGTGLPLDFGLQTIAGNYTISAINAATGCSNAMTGGAAISVNPLPTAFSILGGGSYCAGGAGEDVSLGGSEATANYQLMVDGSPTGSAIAGDGGTVDFGMQTNAGTYTVVATNISTGCVGNMSGSATVTANPLPNAYTVTGGGSYCSGTGGVDIGLDGSDAGVSYVLYTGAVASESSLSGTGASIDFGNQTGAGSYTVVATDPVTGCASTMFGSTAVSIYPTPAPFDITGGGGYCAGGAGVDVGLTGSETGATYELFNGALMAGVTIGTGLPLDFGVFAGEGNYVVTATNAEGCVATMPGSTTITINALPDIYNVTPAVSENYCAGGTGVDVGLDGSGTGVSYQLFNSGNPVTTATGSGSPIDFGLQMAGSYTVVATNTTTSCISVMTGNALIIASPLPVAYTVTGGGGYCAGGPGVDVALTASNAGVGYTLMNGVYPIVTVTGLGDAINFGSQYASGTYTIVAADPATLCSNTMFGAAVVTINPLPNSSYMITGGGAYCSGGTGVDISINNSDYGIGYQLVNAGVPVGSVLPGNSGTAVDFGLQTTAGSYTVLATDATTACSSILTGTAAVSINPSPGGVLVTGGGTYCYGTAGANVGLSASFSGINYQLMNGSILAGARVAGSGSPLDFGAQQFGTYSVVATDQVTGCSANMYGSVIVTAEAAPATYTLTGGGFSCPGGSGVRVGLSGSGDGINYQLMDGGMPTGTPLSGTGEPIDFGSQTAGGNYSVIATSGSTGCTATMAGTAIVTTSPLPTRHNVTGGGTFCPGGAGVGISLDGSDLGINYQLMKGLSPAGAAIAGSGGAISFGLQNATGSYSVVATNGTTACTDNMMGSVSVGNYSLPVAYNVTGGGNYCPGGTGVPIGLSSSVTGVSYQLYSGEGAVGSPLPGTGHALEFGLESAPGVYTVVAANTLTTCTNNMTGAANVSISALPAAFTVTGGGSYCYAGAGLHVVLSGSSTGTIYQLYNGIVAGTAVTGTGSSIDFGAQTTAGNYTVLATSLATSCATSMVGNATIAVNPLPAVHVVSTGGSYCAGGAGVDVSLNSSDEGIQYQLYNGTAAVGSAINGTGTLINYGEQSSGVYTIVATNMTTGCNNNMSGVSTVTANPLPNVFTVTGGGNYCSGGAGIQVGLSGSNTGITYEALTGGAPTGSAVSGTGTVLDLGLKTVAGSYSVLATNTATGCSSTMTGSVSVGVNPLPALYTVSSPGGNYCEGGAGIDIALGGSIYGTYYQLYDGATIMGAATGTGAGIDFGLQTTAGRYTVVATNPATGCNNHMTGAATITVNPLPTAYTTVGGGSFCDGGTGIHVGLNGSYSGASYQLYNGGTASGSPLTGTGLSLDFGAQTAAGSYKVIATNPGTGCSNAMTGNANVSINPLPEQYTVTGGGNYCAGGAGVAIGLTGSTGGVNYQLYKSGVRAGTPIAGTGIALALGLQTGMGAYTVVATDATTGCSSNMASGATVGVNSLPVSYATSGGGNYCAGGVGTSVGLGGSAAGIMYQLYNGSTPAGGALAGTGAIINFGLQTAPGTYSIVATNTATGCANSMSGTASVGINPSPVAYSVTGGGNYCATGAGVHIGITNSTTGVSYQLFNGTAIGSPVTGTGGTLDFGLQTATGTYTVVASDDITSCTNNMTGSASIGITPLVYPSVSVSSGAGATSCAGNSVTISSSAVNGGGTPTFAWTVNGASVAATGSTFSYVPSNEDVVSVTMTSSVPCATPSAVSNSQTLTVLANGTPTISVAATPGQVVCQGTSVTFNNAITFGGSPTFTWFVNGVEAGTAPSYTYTPANSDVVSCIMNSTYQCRLANAASSNQVTMEVDENVPPVVGISANPGTNIAQGQSLTLTASVGNGGPSPLFQWYLNGVALPGATDASLTGSNYNNGDSISCQVISSGGCAGLSGYSSVRIEVGSEGVQQVSSAASDIKLVPNPNKGIFTINGTLGTANDEEVTVEVTDMLGQVIYTNKVMSHGGSINEKVQLNGALPNGMYILNLRSGIANDVFHVVIEQ